MWKIFVALFYTFKTISNALELNFSLLENKSLPAGTDVYISKEELKFVVSLGVFKDGDYVHICLAVMITGLNGITAGKCGDYNYYAEIAGLIQSEKHLTEENRTKLHVNTKRPIHSDPDMLYTVIQFIDFDKHVFNQRKEEVCHERFDIGVIVVKKKVQYTRPLIKVPISTIKELPLLTNLTLIGMNTTDERLSGERMLMKKRIMNLRLPTYTDDPYLQPHQFRVLIFNSDFRFSKKDLGGPVYWQNQLVGILVSTEHGIVTIDADLDEHIDKIIASTYIPRMKKSKPKRKATTT